VKHDAGIEFSNHGAARVLDRANNPELTDNDIFVACKITIAHTT